MWKCGNAFSRVIQKYSKFANFTLLYFRHFTIFTTKLHNFTKFRKLFPTVLKLFSNLKVCVVGEWSIDVILFSAIAKLSIFQLAKTLLEQACIKSILLQGFGNSFETCFSN